jgi:signal transduction histidine kinase
VIVATIENAAVLTVRDYGKGISAQKLEKLRGGLETGVGFGGMRARVRELQGKFEIESGGAGTTLRIILPLAEAHSFTPETSALRNLPA